MPPHGEADHTSRTRALAKILLEQGFDGAAIVPGPNFYYLTGLSLHLMERPTLLLITATGELRAVIPEIERGAWTRAVPHAETAFWKDSEGPHEAIRTMFGTLRGKLAVEGLRMRVRERDLIAAATNGLLIADGQNIISEPRLSKSDAEIEIVRRAIAISESTLMRAIAGIFVGMTEMDLKRSLSLAILEEGGDGPAFDPIVLFGAAAADCHGQSNRDRRLKAGDAVLIDFGAAYGGYNADITRTFFARTVADEDRRLYEAVATANEIGRNIARPGLTASELDERVTESLVAAGYAHHVVHKTGHGLGIDVHEAPQIMVGNYQPLAAGMLFTVEPGLYVHGRTGIRIEDNVLVTDAGAESLSTFSRELTLVA